MKKVYLLFIVALFAWFSGLKAQNITLDGPLKNEVRCFAAEALDRFIKAHPGAETIQQFEAWISQKIAEIKASPRAEGVNPVVTIPVVFHIVHNAEAVGTGRNLSQAAIRQQVLQLNKDFTNLMHSPYAVAEDMGIRFALAQNDPAGVALAEPGIDRINRVVKGWSAPPYTVGYASSSNYLTNTIKPNSIWDPYRYLNIWVSQYEAGILGIATFPISSGLPGLFAGETDLTAGVAIDYTTVGSLFAPQGCGSYGKGRTLTHEIGHFFGLRHIWGDATCGDDFCGDTPTHNANNSGEPVHPKPNSCGTPDEMFENYMDYSNDVIFNTFTINQGDRMEAVMANSPRRITLATSNAGNIAPTGTNAISFSDCDGALSVSETGLVSTCPRYRDVTLVLNVENKATATTTVTINTAGTAVSGRDYQLMTPSVTFNNGDDAKAVVLRIFDNAVADGNRTIIVSYTIGGGGGVIAGATAQVTTVTIVDNDTNLPINMNGPSTVALLSQDFGVVTGSNQIPSGWTFNAGTNLWVVNPTNSATYGFTGNTAHITNGNATLQANGTAPIGYNTGATTDARLFTPSLNTTGLKNLKLSFDYVAEGELFQGTFYDYGIVYYSINGANYFALTDQYNSIKIFQGVSTLTNISLNLPPAAYNAPTLSFLFRWLNDNLDGTQPPFVIDNVMVTGDKQTIESEVGQTSVENIGTGTDNYLYSSTDGQLLARITNSTEAVGCVTASVVATGAGNTAIATSGGNGFRSNKVIRVTPTVANSTADYQLTIYFSNAEMAGWVGPVNNLKIMKLVNGAYVDNIYIAADGHVVPTTYNDQSANGYHAYTATITDGFSDFMLVSSDIILPVNLLNFEARAQKTNILLKWSTAQEFNNKGFAIERSTSGSNYEKIGWVDGNFTTAIRSDYTFTDNFVQPDVLYHYRLRQTDLDNQQRLSEIRQAKIISSGVSITLSPNPAKDEVKLFIFGGRESADIDLVNVQGQIVKRWRKLNATSGPTKLDVNGLAPGVYVLSIQFSGERITRKLVIE